MVWISVVLVVAVGMFLLRDNIAKFINNAATQIAGEESGDGLNEYGFYFDKTYWCEEDGIGMILHEDGSADVVDENGTVLGTTPPGMFSYSKGVIINENENGASVHISENGKSFSNSNVSYVLKE